MYINLRTEEDLTELTAWSRPEQRRKLYKHKLLVFQEKEIITEAVVPGLSRASGVSGAQWPAGLCGENPKVKSNL